ncbi:hypothetical protein Kpol_1055p27 [Vanderwaltozyma polyspora DSM 70294]|uniref:Synaptonemal complex protein ZIP1 n=1 Tax=Vanderwaltozyma polyspora (strain ATCC 22028 / DSM 70294 / BCRC 21397 / CBS 2163 / NBRC 10782 / NRRL Y-8283 / UCD 57-17) TaxID=436907 RepID=A7TGA2_VANPO|nr:uncharacterized protein Kpol_1055p27 [Vanderwaltozyma polyspora DSM 70294]EDO18672.1 hypothetical protein Kpol_1055p27 [Vanderwaltozyma polyspora DSM 70294]
MSNFFRDSSMAFKPRTNIFSKLRVREPEHSGGDTSINGEEGEEGEENSSIIENLFMSTGHPHEGESTEGSTVISKNNNLDELSDKKVLGRASLQSSTPKSAHRMKEDFEDELEITEVRNVSPIKKNISSRSSEFLAKQLDNDKATNDRFESTEASSNDVLLEAFTNTQKICSSLKQELSKQQQENSKLKLHVKSYDNESKKILEKFTDYKKSLTLLEEKSKWLLEQKKINDTKFQDLKRSNKAVTEKLTNCKNDVDNLKVSLIKMKNSKAEVENEIARKVKEIEYLKKELDNCSGQLSEEKIKNSSLLMEFSRLRDHSSKQLDETAKKMNELYNNMVGYLETELSKRINDKLDSSNEKILEKIDVNKLETVILYESQMSQYEQHFKQFEATEMKALENIQSVYKANSENLKVTLTSSVTEVSESIESLKDKMISHENLSIEKVDNLSVELSQFKNQVFDCKEYDSKINSLSQEISDLKLQKTQTLSLLGTKEAEFEEASKKLIEQTAQLEKYIISNDTMTTSIKNLGNELKEAEINIDRLKDEEKVNLSNYENKIAAHTAISNTLNSENEMLKKRIAQLEEASTTIQEENTKKKDRYQKINDQLNKLNVEVVQLKAHELELEEENRRLKTKFEEERNGYEETYNEVKRYKQKIILLESDKQEIVSEKLELQDSIEQLKKTIDHLKKENLKKEKINTINNDLKTNGEKHPEISENFKNPYVSLNIKDAESLSDTKSQKIISSQYTSFPQRQQSKLNKKDEEGNDEFDLSSSMNDDLEMTMPSPVAIKQVRNSRNCSQLKKATIKHSRKKLLIPDDDVGMKSNNKKRKKKI